MSGQISAVEQQTFTDNNLGNESNLLDGDNIQELAISDPVFTFLEKHGYKFTLDHQGNRVTYNEAVAGCPALAELITAMGDSVLGLTAARHGNENELEDEDTEEQAEPVDSGTIDDEIIKQGIEQNSDVIKDEIIPQPTEKKNAVIQVVSSQPRNGEANSFEVEVSETTDVNIASSAGSKKAKHQPQANTQSVSNEPVSSTGLPVTEKKPSEIEEITQATASPAATEISKPAALETPELPLPEFNVEAKKPQQGTLPQTEVRLEEAVEEFQIPTREVVSAANESNKTEDATADAFIAELEGLEPSGELFLDYEKQPTAAEYVEVQEYEAEPYLIDPAQELPWGYLLQNERPDTEHDEFSNDVINEVEEAILHVNTRIEVLESEDSPEVDETLQMASELLDEIMVLVERSEHIDENTTELAANEEVLAPGEAEEKLKQLFSDLFEVLNIEYTPELAESCAKFALKTGAEKILLIDRRQDEDELIASDETGTHEVLKKILAAISSVKKSLVHAYTIGKTALRLFYSHADSPLILPLGVKSSTIKA